MSQVWSRVVSVLIQGGLWGWEALQKLSSETHNSKAKVIWKSFELNTNASQACIVCLIYDIKDVIWLTRYIDFLFSIFLSSLSVLETSWGYWLISCMHQTGSLTIINVRVLFWLNRKLSGHQCNIYRIHDRASFHSPHRAVVRVNKT